MTSEFSKCYVLCRQGFLRSFTLHSAFSSLDFMSSLLGIFIRSLSCRFSPMSSIYSDNSNSRRVEVPAKAYRIVASLRFANHPQMRDLTVLGGCGA